MKESRKTRVLLVEDHEIAQRVFSMVMAAVGCDCDLASTGAQALQLFYKNDYDLIFMDIGLPDFNGLDIAEKMRHANTEIPILMLTAYSDDSYQERAKSIGLNDFVIKPLTVEKCDELVKRFVSHKNCGLIDPTVEEE